MLTFAEVTAKKERFTTFLNNNENIFIPTNHYHRDNINDNEKGDVIVINSKLEIFELCQYDWREENEWCKFNPIYDIGTESENYLFGYVYHPYYYTNTSHHWWDEEITENTLEKSINKYIADYYSKKGYDHKEITWALYNAHDLSHSFSKKEITDPWYTNQWGDFFDLDYRLLNFKDTKIAIRAANKLSKIIHNFYEEYSIDPNKMTITKYHTYARHNEEGECDEGDDEYYDNDFEHTSLLKTTDIYGIIREINYDKTNPNL